MTLSIKDLKKILGQGPASREPRSPDDQTPRRPGHRENPIDVRSSNTVFASFFSIETGSECNRSCSFCPVSHSPREHDEWMSRETFDRIVDQLVEMNYTQRIALYSYNEPVRDKRLPELIANVRLRLPKTCIMINSNGDYFKTSDDIKRLYDAGLNQMQINVYSSADGSGNQERIDRGIVKARQRQEFLQGLVDQLPWLDQEASIYQHIGANSTACQVVPKFNFQPTSDHSNKAPTEQHGISVRHHIANRAGNIPNFMPALDEPMRKMCIRPFRAMTINWRGNVLLCCNTYHDGEASVGNVSDRSLIELWNDPRYHAYRIKLQAKDRNIYACATCDYNGGFYSHNVPHVTMGGDEDARIVAADMRTSESAGFGPEVATKLIQLRRKEPKDLPASETVAEIRRPVVH